MSSPLDELTGSQDRSLAILAIVKEAIDEGDATLEKVQAKTDRFPNFGELGVDELAAAVEILGSSKSLENFEAPHANADGQSHQDAPSDAPQPEMTRDQAHAQLHALQDTLHVARQSRMAAESEVRSARAEMATVIAEWNGSGGGYTREQLVREHIAAEQQRKQDVKDGKGVPHRGHRGVGNSYFDRVGAYGRGDANTFVRKSHTAGQPWRGGNRGALPLSMLKGKLDTKGTASVGPVNTK